MRGQPWPLSFDTGGRVAAEAAAERSRKWHADLLPELFPRSAPKCFELFQSSDLSPQRLLIRRVLAILKRNQHRLIQIPRPLTNE
jgi:hypothetical protein